MNQSYFKQFRILFSRKSEILFEFYLMQIVSKSMLFIPIQIKISNLLNPNQVVNQN